MVLLLTIISLKLLIKLEVTLKAHILRKSIAVSAQHELKQVYTSLILSKLFILYDISQCLLHLINSKVYTEICMRFSRSATH